MHKLILCLCYLKMVISTHIMFWMVKWLSSGFLLWRTLLFHQNQDLWLLILWKFSAGSSDEQIWNRQMLLENLGNNSGLTISNGSELAKLNQSCLSYMLQSRKSHSGLSYQVISGTSHHLVTDHWTTILKEWSFKHHKTFFMTHTGLQSITSMWSHDFSTYITSYLHKINFTDFSVASQFLS